MTSASVASVTLRVGAGKETSAHKGHHCCHLGQESSLASNKRRVALLENSICNIGWWNDERRFFSGHLKEMLSNKISHSGNSVSMVSELLLKYVASIKQGSKVTLGISGMVKHVGPGAFNNRASVLINPVGEWAGGEQR